jgi:hypothetical protein
MMLYNKWIKIFVGQIKGRKTHSINSIGSNSENM